MLGRDSGQEEPPLQEGVEWTQALCRAADLPEQVQCHPVAPPKWGQSSGLRIQSTRGQRLLQVQYWFKKYHPLLFQSLFLKSKSTVKPFALGLPFWGVMI